MDYKEKYNAALERARKLQENSNGMILKKWLWGVFPELKESEEERSKKWILEYLYDGLRKSDEQFKGQFKAAIAWLEKQESVGEIVEKCKASWYNEGKIQGQIEGLSDEEKYQQGWHDALEKQSQTFTKKDVDDAYLKGVTNAKNEIEKQYKATYQIRKDIATFIFNYRGDIKDRAKWMEYLGIKVSFVEKQYEKPQGKSALEAIEEEKVDNANKVEDKQKSNIEKGKWYVCDFPRYTDFIVGKAYYCPKNAMLKPNEDAIARYVARDCFHLWTIQDAKDGDVLAFSDDTIVIFKDLYNSSSFHSYCHIEDGEFGISEDDMPDWWKGKGFLPATKEQRDTLIAKMREAGYEWDAENKELKLLITNGGDFESENCGQKPAWSEEDERICQCLIEDQEESLDKVSNDKYGHSEIISDLKEMYGERIDWFKTIKERIGWKPSGLQIEALESVTENCAYSEYQDCLRELIKQLKKL